MLELNLRQIPTLETLLRNQTILILKDTSTSRPSEQKLRQHELILLYSFGHPRIIIEVLARVVFWGSPTPG